MATRRRLLAAACLTGAIASVQAQETAEPAPDSPPAVEPVPVSEPGTEAEAPAEPSVIYEAPRALLLRISGTI